MDSEVAPVDPEHHAGAEAPTDQVSLGAAGARSTWSPAWAAGPNRRQSLVDESAVVVVGAEDVHAEHLTIPVATEDQGVVATGVDQIVNDAEGSFENSENPVVDDPVTLLAVSGGYPGRPGWVLTSPRSDPGVPSPALDPRGLSPLEGDELFLVVVEDEERAGELGLFGHPEEVTETT